MIQINLPKLIAFIKKQSGWIVSAFLLVVVFFLMNRTTNLEKKSQEYFQDAEKHKINADFYKGIYDKLVEEDNALEVKYDSLVLEKNKIKIQYNEKIKIINAYTVLDMQRYFDERTK
jgi:hypothetical protein